MLPPGNPVRQLVTDVAGLLHSDQYLEGARVAAAWVAKTSGINVEITDKSKADEVLTLLLHWLLENDGYEEAAELLWGENLFTCKPDSARRVWKAFTEHNFILLMGGASTSKSYSVGVRLMLEWVRDPHFTSVRVLGPSENHLEENLFTHLVTLHQQSSIPLPGQVAQLFIGMDPRSRKGAIAGIVIPLGKKAAGRIQGAKRVNRKHPHPKFGKLTRQFIFLDEVANIPIGIWKDIENLLAASQGDDGMKIIGAFNPTDVHDEVGKRVEFPGGWNQFDPDKDFDWVSTRGWRVVRLDPAQLENVVQGKVIYPGLQTLAGFNKVIESSGGIGSSGYWTMARGCFPPTGVPMSVIPAGMLVNLKAEVVWFERPTPVGAVDLAFLGGDTACFAKGSFGMATGIKFPPSVEHPTGRTEMFKSPKGNVLPRNMLLVEAILKLPKGDTILVKNEIVRIARQYSIRPEWLCVDKTGNGAGVFDLLRFDYGEVVGVNYSEAASETRIMSEDHAPCNELYERAQSELWFATRKFIEFQYCKIAFGVETEELFQQLSTRRFRMTGRRAKVEPKNEWESRCQGKSPDAADSLTLLVHCVRKAAGFIPGMSSENSSEWRDGEEGDYENEPPRIDVTNRMEYL